ncbi:MAG: class I SAM-dependent methyltransferase [Desulfamplus sp.]|nr:class I SAM-dependent methyltransferase [Desulfamplus sp.]
MITIDFNRLDLKSGYKILDIGCGEGRHTAKAWEFENTFCVGADMCYKDLAVAKEKIETHEEFIKNYLESKNKTNFQGLKSQVAEFQSAEPQNSQVQSSKLEDSDSKCSDSQWVLCNSDINLLPFADNTFDIVICSEVMEHIHQEQKALEELKRVLKPKGQLALSVPRYLPEKICWKLSKEYCNTEGGHIRIYKKKELLEKIIPLGFQFYGSHYAHSLHTPFWWLKCLMGCPNQSVSNSNFNIINLYHKLLVWDIMENPFITRFIEKLLNPIIGKSLALYFIKNTDSISGKMQIR